MHKHTGPCSYLFSFPLLFVCLCLLSSCQPIRLLLQWLLLALLLLLLLLRVSLKVPPAAVPRLSVSAHESHHTKKAQDSSQSSSVWLLDIWHGCNARSCHYCAMCCCSCCRLQTVLTNSGTCQWVSIFH
jgi:hypothetical protein